MVHKDLKPESPTSTSDGCVAAACRGRGGHGHAPIHLPSCPPLCAPEALVAPPPWLRPRNKLRAYRLSESREQLDRHLSMKGGRFSE